ncbi:GNAT family N-acetyltransferase [Nonomuraea zeae]|uniref:GNAT family N-acetyltransferase n=1 Tax=Nonomuraea zeae TaxID=1642303 RepID=A0A5S4FRW7_9ACTN|nr:GNAT family N-acetyltransferase [Nonomuraea zeae]TMR23389.1 GNAT family N-acetyltransferase [Nonomuraea zeae]
MMIQPIDPASQGDLITGLYDAYMAAGTDNAGPQVPFARFRRELCLDSPAQRAEVWAVVEDGKVAGGYCLSLYRLDNTHTGRVFPLVVRPEHRGRGLGSALFEHAAERLRADGRRLMLTETPSAGAGARFAHARGMTVALVEARRTFDLRTADWAALERMVPQVAGYSLEQWIGPAGPELLPDLATLMSGMNDAPRDDDVEDQHFSLDRIRDREQRIPDSGQTCYTTIARRDSDGAPAGYTRICLKADRSDGWGAQTDTTVLAGHRGHRLGLLLKLANLFWLREREPHLERIITWNATSNTHMLAINEAMGFEFFDEWNQWRLSV